MDHTTNGKGCGHPAITEHECDGKGLLLERHHRAGGGEGGPLACVFASFQLEGRRHHLRRLRRTHCHVTSTSAGIAAAGTSATTNT